MNIAVTGASGFVGGNLIPYLKSLNHNVLAISRTNKFTYSYLDSIFIDKNNINIVIHLAGKAHDFKKTIRPSEYFEANTELTISLFNEFLNSKASTFIYFSSVKAVTDKGSLPITEEFNADPISVYGISKLKAETYIQSMVIPESKKVFILRPCMVHGPGNKGNLNLLYKIVSKNLPWPLGAFDNLRSFCSIDNILFILKELIEREDILSGVYNVADDEPLSTNSIIKLIAVSQDQTAKIWNLPKAFIFVLAKFGDAFRLPLNSESLQKLTESYVVSNKKILLAIGKSLPVSSKDGLMKTLKSFK
ncbi:MAG: NAD-dependent epimerase/dehydratase family protein [Sediminibacterium sp.]|uniref:NAD-dependent epimerase/dehydratase family protein n=1 Tax=Sediminibacterium sp. TaxID=1917865 RepID=UPI002720ACE5|nr:NAD-dependent epimerase/dehydratase family protein [Sediminibacterium sp.]MDO8997131.1 NAD-dependent epimerase/dehydratase family protein [Sediminibacterium sp.]